MPLGGGGYFTFFPIRGPRMGAPLGARGGAGAGRYGFVGGLARGG